MSQLDTKTLKNVIKLMKDYENCLTLSPQEYIDGLMADEKNLPEKVAEIFLVVKKHEKILECTVESYKLEFKLKEEDQLLVMLLIYLILFELSETNYEVIKDIFKKLKLSMCINLLKFLNREEFPIIVTEVSCTVFDNDYVLNAIITPLLRKANLIENLQHESIEHFADKKQITTKTLTKPLSPRLTKTESSIRKVKTPVVKNPKPKINPVPVTTYHEHNIKKKIEEACNENRENALRLLKQANLTAFRVSKIVREAPPTAEYTSAIIKAHKVPKFKDVEVKNNATALMREAALFVKNQEKEIKKLESLMSGAFDDTLFEKWEEEERLKLQQEHIQAIEKKHLQGLLTYEEALLAKQNLIKANKVKILEIKAEKEVMYKNLEEWRKEEQEKVKVLVEKAQNIQKSMKEAERKNWEEKYQQARELDLETKALLEKAMAEKQAELNRKIELIKELKALQSLREYYHKEFDPTETPNLGLMCEMSIAELQERLGLLKLELQQELEEKQKNILEYRQQRKDLLQNAQEFIEVSRNARKIENKPKRFSVQLEETPEIAALKNKLSEVRKLRMTDF